MIDTLTLSLPLQDLQPNYGAFLKQMLTNKKTVTTDNRTTATGMYKNLKVYFNDQGLIISNSLVTYSLGSNQYTLTQDNIKKAVEELSEDFQVPLINSKILRLDLAENIVTKFAPQFYYPILDSVRYLGRYSAPNGVDFRNSSRYIGVYNKIKELQDKHVTVTPVLQDRHVLRLEYRYKNHKTLAHFLKLPVVLMSDVLINYGKLVDSWADAFFTIHKKREVLLIKPEVFGSTKLLKDHLTVLGIEQLGGQDAIFKLIANAKRSGVYQYPNGSTNQKTWVRKLMAQPGMTETIDLATELDQKVSWIKFINTDHASPSLDFDTGIMT